MCLKIRTSYQNQKAVAVRVEQLPSIDWVLYQEMRDSLQSRSDLGTFRQGRGFQVGMPYLSSNDLPLIAFNCVYLGK